MGRARAVCTQPGCPTLTDTGRCREHRRDHDNARGTKAQRGYDAAFRRTRAHWQRRLNTGEPIHCWRCHKPIDPTDWHLGHDDHNRNLIRGPEHPTCNLSAAGHASHTT